MFGLDTLSRPVAIAEMLLLLAFAAFVGWLLGRLVLNGQISALRAAIADKKAGLEDGHRSGATVTPTYATPRSEPIIETPVAYVSADPLLPAFSLDNTPDLIAAGTVDSPGVDSLGVDSLGRSDGPLDSPTVLPAAPVSSATLEMPITGNSEAALLNRIAARVNEINFDRIGRATAAEADDLKDIIGVGPFLERKLHSLGIYTFRQVANFTKEDANKVNSIIEFFPGRIERDDWVDQSKAFHERKYGRSNQTHE